MATRHYPVSGFGKIPKLDSHLTRGSDHTSYRIKGGGREQIKGLTAARLKIVEKLGLQDQYTEESLSVARAWPDKIKAKKLKMAPTKKAAKSSAKKAPAKAAKVVQEAVSDAPKMKRKYTRRAVEALNITAPNANLVRPPQPISPAMPSYSGGRDIFDSANRIYLRVPLTENLAPAEISFPKDIGAAQLHATMNMLKELKKR